MESAFSLGCEVQNALLLERTCNFESVALTKRILLLFWSGVLACFFFYMFHKHFSLFVKGLLNLLKQYENTC